MPTWYMVRHAEKEKGDFFNPILRHQDEPISANGQRQAEKLAEYFADKGIARIYISAYARTGQTAAPTARALGLTPVLDERLNEIDNGLVDKLSDAELEARYPELMADFKARSHDFRFPGGETGEEVRQRLDAFFREKLAEHGEETLLIVAHEGLLRLLMCYVQGLPVWKRWNYSYDFCGVTQITYLPAYGEWQVNRFNHVCR